jgi:hypothetical protein
MLKVLCNRIGSAESKQSSRKERHALLNPEKWDKEIQMLLFQGTNK